MAVGVAEAGEVRGDGQPARGELPGHLREHGRGAHAVLPGERRMVIGENYFPIIGENYFPISDVGQTPSQEQHGGASSKEETEQRRRGPGGVPCR